MKLSELPEDFTPEQFMQLDREALDQIPYERKKWICQVKGCCGGTHVRDYGLSPWFMLDRGSKKSIDHPQEYWRNLDYKIWLCCKHWKRFDKLFDRYGWDHVARRLLKPEPLVEQKLIDVENKHRGKHNNIQLY